jgi:hypothetical protein
VLQGAPASGHTCLRLQSAEGEVAGYAADRRAHVKTICRHIRKADELDQIALGKYEWGRAIMIVADPRSPELCGP